MSYHEKKSGAVGSFVRQLMREGRREFGIIRRQVSRRWGHWFTPSRVRRLKVGLVIGVIALPLLDMFVYEPRHIELTTYYVPMQSLPRGLDGMRIVQMSDLHCGKTTPNDVIARAVEIANSANPDIVVLTGDFVTYHESSSLPLSEMLSKLRPRLGAYAVLGNHDHEVSSVTVTTALERSGIRVLTNHSAQPAGGFHVVGIDDPGMGKPDVQAAFEGIEEGACCVTLAHTPTAVYLLKGRQGLLLTGHTHGGQVRFPMASGRMVPGFVGGKYIGGWYLDGNLRTYVNRGIGMTNMPMRFLCRPEVTLFVLRPAPGQRR